MQNHIPSPAEDLQDLRPRARADEVVVTEVEGEALVYDLLRHRAHRLNPVAALIWQHCDGQTTVRQLAALRSGAEHQPLGEAVVWLSLRQLAGAQLLDAATPLPAAAPRYSRQQLIRAGMVGSALLLPVVGTILVPNAAAHASAFGGCGPDCPPDQCQGGICLVVAPL
jgi:hypothetical protein